MPAPEGHCWLCNKYGKLTREHIPPEKAFNDCPYLLLKVDERSSKTGLLEWTSSRDFERGLYFRSLCQECNNKYGSKYGGAYVDLVRRIAERIGDVRERHRISILGIKRPLAILKQVMLQFVTANGPKFVRTNPWVAPFIRNRLNTSIPRNIAIYVFASNARTNRNSGVSAHIDLNTKRANIVSEFTFWPLGTVISFRGELTDERLTPIHHWTQYSFNYSGLIDLHLCVNPIITAYPIDFRTESQVQSGATSPAEPTAERFGEEILQDMIQKALTISGEEKEKWIYSGHPNTFRQITEKR
jgi:hypothetical protein